MTAAVINIAACLLLIPLWGTTGAAIASLVTYAVYSFGGFLRYRKLEDQRYPLDLLAKLGLIALAAAATLPRARLAAASPWVALAVAMAWTLAAGAVALLTCGRDLLPSPAEARRRLRDIVARGSFAR